MTVEVELDVVNSASILGEARPHLFSRLEIELDGHRAVLENKAGKFVVPTTASGQVALTATSLPENLIAWNPDPEPADAYPIVTYTWLLCYKRYPDKRKAEILRDLLNYTLTDGQKDAEPLGYIPLPDVVVEKVKSAAQSIEAAPAS